MKDLLLIFNSNFTANSTLSICIGRLSRVTQEEIVHTRSKIFLKLGPLALKSVPLSQIQEYSRKSYRYRGGDLKPTNLEWTR